MSSSLLQFMGMGRVYVGSGSITTTALAAAGEEELTISDSNAAVNDVVHAHFDATAAATGGTPSVAMAWVSASGTIKVRVTNQHASTALDAGAKTVLYTLHRAS